jgi:hypothetical protein
MKKREEEDAKIRRRGFDLTVTHRDPYTGVITHTDPYIMRSLKAEGGSGRTRVWERPAGSGNLFDRDNEPVGRWVKDGENPNGVFKRGAPHVAYEAPLTNDQKVARENMALKAELAAMKAEQEKKAEPVKNKAKES